MSDTKKELESQFEKLPKLKHVGMALMQYAERIFRSETVLKDELGTFCVGFGCVCFHFPKGGNSIGIIFPRLDANTINRENTCSIMPPKITHQMVLKNNEAGFACLEIDDASLLGQAAIYIQKSTINNLKSRLIPPEGGNLN